MQDGFVSVAARTPRVRVADVDFNVEACEHEVTDAAQGGAKIVVLPELAVTGYTCEDLFWQDKLLRAAERGVARLAHARGEVLRALRGFHVCSAARDRRHKLRDVRHRRSEQVAEINDRRSDRSKDWCECRCQAVFEQAQRAHNGIDRTVDRAAHLREVRKALFNRIPETVDQSEN